MFDKKQKIQFYIWRNINFCLINFPASFHIFNCLKIYYFRQKWGQILYLYIKLFLPGRYIQSYPSLYSRGENNYLCHNDQYLGACALYRSLLSFPWWNRNRIFFFPIKICTRKKNYFRYKVSELVIIYRESSTYRAMAVFQPPAFLYNEVYLAPPTAQYTVRPLVPHNKVQTFPGLTFPRQTLW